MKGKPRRRRLTTTLLNLASVIFGVASLNETALAATGGYGQAEVPRPDTGFVAPGCPANGSAVFSQLPDFVNWTLAFSDQGKPPVSWPTRYESFCGLGARISGLRFWGLDFAYPYLSPPGNDWTQCAENPMGFEIKFYADAGGSPGAAVCSYTLSLPRTLAGQVGYAQYNVYEYNAVLDPPCVLQDGWVSIRGVGDPNCWFAWMSSADGDARSRADTGWPAIPEWSFDLALCLTSDGAPVYGACCNERTGGCRENVTLADCDGRFSAGGTCADFTPPCGQRTGACCLNDGTCEIRTSVNCFATLSCPGDLNCDGRVNFKDINAFVVALSQPAAYALAFPDCRIENADCNGDGTINFHDINPFIVRLGTECAGPRGTWPGAGSTCAVCPPRRIECPADLPYRDTNSTCGRPNSFDATCLDAYDGGSDILYELVVTGLPEALEINLVLDADEPQYTGLLLTDHYPPDMNCIAMSTSAAAATHGLGCLSLAPGTYYILVDNWPAPACIPHFGLEVIGCATMVGRCCFDNRAPCAEITEPVCSSLGGTWTAGVDCTTPCPSRDGEACGDAWPIPVVPFERTFDNTSMTADGPAAPCDKYGAGGPMQNDAWFAWTPTQSGLAVASATAESSYDVVLVVREGCGSPTVLECADTDPNYPETVRFAATAGRTYYFQVGSVGNFPGGGLTRFVLELLTGTGTCCQPDGSCVVRTGVDCLRRGGRYGGDYTDCETLLCWTFSHVGDTCDDPIRVTLSSASLPYVDNNTTGGRGDNYRNTCLGNYDSGNDIIYELTVPQTIVLSFTLDPQGTPYTGMLLSHGCPDQGECIVKSINTGTNAHGLDYVVLMPGVYTLMIDKWMSPPFSNFQLTISNSDTQTGACCLGTTCLATEGLAACLDGGGTWYRGATCSSSACPFTPVNTCSDPVVVSLPNELPYSYDSDTHLRGTTYAGTTCLGVFDGGRDAVFELDVAAAELHLDIYVSADEQRRLGVAVFDTCPPSRDCIAIAQDGLIRDLALPPGRYFLMIDMWPRAQGTAWVDFTAFTLQIQEAWTQP